MVEISWMLAASAWLTAFTLGAMLGARIEARRWRDKAKDEPRVESAGRLYHVIEDGDRDKLARVAEWPWAKGGAS